MDAETSKTTNAFAYTAICAFCCSSAVLVVIVAVVPTFWLSSAGKHASQRNDFESAGPASNQQIEARPLSNQRAVRHHDKPIDETATNHFKSQGQSAQPKTRQDNTRRAEAKHAEVKQNRATSLSMYFDEPDHPQMDKVGEAGSLCFKQLGVAHGDGWVACVVDSLLKQQQAARQSGRDDFFPLVPQLLQPFGPMQHGPGAETSEALKHLLRNFSCDVEDGGSLGQREITWSWRPPAASNGALAEQREFTYKKGYLPAGNDLHNAQMSENEAMEACGKMETCEGFTFQANSRAPEKRHSVFFKSSSVGGGGDGGWHHYRRRPRGPPLPSVGTDEPRELRVEVLRETPPVYLVHEFATQEECDYMTNLTIPAMTRSVVGGGGVSSSRQSYSVNMFPDFDDETHVVTRLSRRKFAFAREVAGYVKLHEGEGQEPINAVYYKDFGDQYRPHCDGVCHGGKHRSGIRIASSLTYCAVADKGGYTYFSRSSLKVVPKPRQMLFFGYKLKDEQMDNGLTEHTGCPVREGRKWIATQWYREGITAEKNWEYYARTRGM